MGVRQAAARFVLRQLLKAADPAGSGNISMGQLEQNVMRIAPGISTLWGGQSRLAAMKESEFLAIAVLRVSEAVMFAEGEIYHEGSDRLEPDNSLVWKWLKKPNPFYNLGELLEKYSMHLLLRGNGYLAELNHSSFGNPTQVWALNPERVSLIPDPVTFIKGYEYQVGGKKIIFQPDHIHHGRLGNPEDDFMGMGRVEAAERLFKTDIAMSRHNENYFANGATPGTVITGTAPMNDEAKEMLRDEFDRQHGGFWNSFKTMFIPSGMDVKPVSNTPRESDFNVSKERVGKSIAALFGIGPVMMGRVENSNKGSAYVEMYLFQKLVLTPLLRRIEPKITEILKKWDSTLAFRFKPVVDEDEELQSTVDTADFQMAALTPNERRERQGRKKIDAPGMDEPWLPANMVPISALLDTPSQDTGNNPPPTAPGTGLPGQPKPQQGAGDNPPQNEPGVTTPAGNEPAPAAPADNNGGKGLVEKSKWKRQAQMRFHRWATRRKKTYHPRFEIRMRKFFQQEGDRIASLVAREKGIHEKFLESVGKAGSDPFEIEEGGQRLLRVIRPIYIDGLETEFNVTADFLGLNPEVYDFAPGNDAFTGKIRKLAGNVKDINQTTKDKLAKLIKDGTEAGYSSSQIANGVPDENYLGIRGLFEKWGTGRAELISRTESSRLFDSAATESYKKLNVKFVDVVGCEDNVIFEGETYGCNSLNIPLAEAEGIEFHPNHMGSIVPRIISSRMLTRAAVRMLTLVNADGIMNAQTAPKEEHS